MEIEGAARPMCCHGCEAVAQAIVDAGYSEFYRRRTGKPLSPADPVPDFVGGVSAYDNPRVQGAFVSGDDAAAETDVKRVSLIIEGITCAACAWLIEQRLQKTPGIAEVRVNYNTHRAVVKWRPREIELSAILERIQSIGYRARPFDPAAHEDVARREHRAFLLRIGVSGALGMQIMMIATAMYFGENGGIDPGHRALFRWLSLFLVLPIIGYCALPFFGAALRDVRNGTLGMDVPVSLGLAVAFGGSAWATWTGSGDVYYESVAMFVFLLLCARFLETRARHRSVAAIEALNQSLPELAERRRDDRDWEPVLASELSPGDTVRVQPGRAFPADGVIHSGQTSANESLLTGESVPVDKRTGSAVMAGAINIEQPVTVAVTRSHDNSVVSQIIGLTEQAQGYKPRLAQLADRFAPWFIAGVLVLAAAAGYHWFVQDPSGWLAVVVSILVVTCPCALSLATPAAITASVNALAAQSVVPVTGAALENLARIDTIVLDKTGTLTEGRLSLADVQVFDDRDSRDQVLATGAALAQSSGHPVARALGEAWRETLLPVTSARHDAGGIEGDVAGTRYFLGNTEYIRARTNTNPGGAETRSCAWLAAGDRVLARFEFDDRVRADARDMLERMSSAGIAVHLFSGDHAAAVGALARRLGISRWRSDMSPADKLAALRTLQDRGHVVAAVGDGTNDAPFLSAADVALSMGGGTDLARINADMVLMKDNLGAVPRALHLARRTRTVIRQNITWAVGYNLLALPAAAAGVVPPWLAAIGMSLSSLIVVSNALRLSLRRPRPRPDPGPEWAPAAG